jgi:hypothetical protein
VYLDGVAQPFAGHFGGCGTQADNTVIASDGNAPEFTLTGKLDDVRIYNRELSATEAKQLYLMGK